MLQDFREPDPVPAKIGILSDRRFDGIDKSRFVDGLGEEVHGSFLHRAHARWNITLARDEDDRAGDVVGTFQRGLQFETIQPRH
ncbi:hypothetical protein MesoLj113c_28260 [Mesorhizobium sp. 113-3-9]|nr:hypothetical protein MesoLj113c_28260 [Mesorhizobium sp. 113-3-9]